MLSVYSWKKSINVDIMLLLYWWILLQVFEAMFRVIKESEYVDERQHCFLIQVDLTQCSLKDTQKDLKTWFIPKDSITVYAKQIVTFYVECT